MCTHTHIRLHIFMYPYTYEFICSFQTISQSEQTSEKKRKICAITTSTALCRGAGHA